ncbi:GDSL esterase/lipase [Hibiscus syriacus]|uniref:GDSL esterase/lipase n=1 Tax=Hibiscus syriacus TaxID=106335 RepID=A0A6A3D6D7_HIBSY|nr:GDSL esterase/lipase [Hibiscus syriacus]
MKAIPRQPWYGHEMDRWSMDKSVEWSMSEAVAWGYAFAGFLLFYASSDACPESSLHSEKTRPTSMNMAALSRTTELPPFSTRNSDICLQFLAQSPEANITYFDIYSIKLNLISNSSLYGFQKPIAACCGYGGPSLNFDNRVPCGVTKDLNGTIVTANPCNNTAEYINWDGTHYTEAANRFVADQILIGNYTDSN